MYRVAWWSRTWVGSPIKYATARVTLYEWIILTHDYDDAEDERHQDGGQQAEEAPRGEPILLLFVIIGGLV